MRCPTDDTPLAITDRQGIEIDYCPECRGVWLDRGELDKLIERSAIATPPPSAPRVDDRRDDRYDRHDDDWGESRGRGRKRERGSFLSEIFEFGG